MLLLDSLGLYRGFSLSDPFKRLAKLGSASQYLSCAMLYPLSILYTALLQSLNHVKTALINGAESFDDKQNYEISNDRHAQLHAARNSY